MIALATRQNKVHSSVPMEAVIIYGGSNKRNAPCSYNLPYWSLLVPY